MEASQVENESVRQNMMWILYFYFFFSFFVATAEKNDYQNFYAVYSIIASNDWKIPCVAKDLNEVFYKVLQSEVL